MEKLFKCINLGNDLTMFSMHLSLKVSQSQNSNLNSLKFADTDWMHYPDSTIFQTLTLLSKPPEAILLLSGEKLINRTPLVWPVSVQVHFLAIISHNFIVLSSLQDAIIYPVLEKVTQFTLSEWPSRVSIQYLELISQIFIVLS